MLSKKVAYAATPVAALGLALTAPAAANADDGLGGLLDLNGSGSGHANTTISTAHIDAMNGSDARGKALIVQRGHEASVYLFVRDVLEDAPHAQHFHIAGEGRCPAPDADTNGDGIVSTVEGQPAYGAIGTSLTTEGDTSPGSGLAVKRFPTAPNGFVVYQRQVTLSDEAAKSVRTGNAVVVAHGLDANDNGKYDFGAGKSELNPALPLEATAPVACGGVDTVASVGTKLDLSGNLELNLDELLDTENLDGFFGEFNSLEKVRDEVESAGSTGGSNDAALNEVTDRVRDSLDVADLGADNNVANAVEDVRDPSGDSIVQELMTGYLRFY